MTPIDWRSLPEATVVALYQRERTHWLETLGWDTASIWTTIESARVSWGLPGVACLDAAGAIRGWAFFMVRPDRLDVGAIVADDIAVTMTLMDAMLERAGGRAVGGFICARAVGLERVVAARGLCAHSHLYLVAPTIGEPSRPAIGPGPWMPPGCQVRAWRQADLSETARFLRDAYGDEGRLFAPHGESSEWVEYVTSLAAHTGCGTLAPELSQVVERSGRIVALALVTTLSAETAHVVQLAVDPGLRGRGIARALIARAMAGAGESRYGRMSLLVARANSRARLLYRSAGFVQCGRFLALASGPIANGHRQSEHGIVRSHVPIAY